MPGAYGCQHSHWAPCRPTRTWPPAPSQPQHHHMHVGQALSETDAMQERKTDPPPGLNVSLSSITDQYGTLLQPCIPSDDAAAAAVCVGVDGWVGVVGRQRKYYTRGHNISIARDKNGTPHALQMSWWSSLFFGHTMNKALSIQSRLPTKWQ